MPSWYCHDNKWPNDSVFFFCIYKYEKENSCVSFLLCNNASTVSQGMFYVLYVV